MLKNKRRRNKSTSNKSSSHKSSSAHSLKSSSKKSPSANQSAYTKPQEKVAGVYANAEVEKRVLQIVR